jgi:hypothetical protein
LDALAGLASKTPPTLFTSLVTASIAASTVTGALATLATTGGVAQAFLFKSNLLRAGYHFQFLAMTCNLAIPEIPNGYRTLVKQLGWITLSFKEDVLSPMKVSRMLLTVSVLPNERVLLLGDMIFLLCVVIVGFCAISVVHLMLCLLYKRCTGKSVCPPLLRYPCLEVLALGFAISALSFYAGIKLGDKDSLDQFGSLGVLLAVATPYGVLLAVLGYIKHQIATEKFRAGAALQVSLIPLELVHTIYHYCCLSAGGAYGTCSWQRVWEQ